MSWLRTKNLDLGITFGGLLALGNETLQDAQEWLSNGPTLTTKSLEMQLLVSQVRGQLSCSVPHLTKALFALQSWTGSKKCESTPILLMTPKQSSYGYALCTQVISLGLYMAELRVLLEDIN